MDKKEIKYSIIGLLILFAIVVAVLFLVYKEKKPELNNYQIEDIKEDQVVFAYYYTHYLNGGTQIVWIFNKEGKQKKINLKQREYSEIYNKDKNIFLSNLDACMANNEEFPFLEKELEVPEEQMSYCINLKDMNLKSDGAGNVDANGVITYVVSGVGEKRCLKAMEIRGYEDFLSKDETTNQVCDMIQSACDRK